jgi:hypothetical protein
MAVLLKHINEPLPPGKIYNATRPGSGRRPPSRQPHRRLGLVLRAVGMLVLKLTLSAIAGHLSATVQVWSTQSACRPPAAK